MDPILGQGGMFGAPAQPVQQQPQGPFGGGVMTPEQVKAYLDYAASQGAWSEQDRAIQQQLAQAVALKNRAQSQHTTGAGAALGGMGDVLNSYMGARQEKNQRVQDKRLQDARIDALNRLAGSWPGTQPQQPLPDPNIPPMLARPPGQ